MFGLGFMEILVIAVAGLVLFGPDKLPQIAAQLGRVFVQLRRVTNDVKSEIDDAIRKAEHDLLLEERAKVQKILDDAAKLPAAKPDEPAQESAKIEVIEPQSRD